MARINVTKAFLPPSEEYRAYTEKIWSSGQLTNQGPLLKEFEQRTSEYLGVDKFHFVANGTLALQLALRVLDITEGEIITTPFSYVATTSAILWERCKPVYVDIEPDTFCIDPQKIEAAITKDTKAILAVHVFGRPCDVGAIDVIAKKHNLKVLYDGAHAFGVRYNGRSLLDCGDVSTGSFHATKLFHTVEGGCVITQNQQLSDRLELMKRFGHRRDEHYFLGINAKASEFQAAMGLCNLKYIDEIIQRRKQRTHLYDELLPASLQPPPIKEDTEYNYSYYPVLFRAEQELLEAVEALNKNDIFPRRYFYPSLNRLPYIKSPRGCSVSEDISKRILCLPLYDDLGEADIKNICGLLKT
jgi:dTDP-4-amino-4,6-dideoxygalactose transaminase